MRINRNIFWAAALVLTSTLAAAQGTPPEPTNPASPSPAIAYSADGKLQLPSDYRQWIFLSSGFGMSYNSNTQPGHHMFNNVFVNPEAWRSFQKTGTWPDKTILVLEIRGGEGKGSIIKGGQYQSPELMGLEVHLRDDAHFKDHWAFFSFDDEKLATVIPHSDDCYACHTSHGAVDSTFVQFYPTLMGLATSHGTLAPGYLEQK